MASKLQLDSPSQLAVTLEDLHVSPITPPSLYNYESYASTSRSASTSSRSASPVAQSNPPRPQNAFMLFRSHFLKHHKSEETRQQVLSQVIGAVWRTMSEEDRQPWVEAGKETARLHKLKYPDYVFSPASRGTRSARSRAPKGNTISDIDIMRITEQMTGRKCTAPAAPRRTPKTRSTEVGSRGKRWRADHSAVEAAPSFAGYSQRSALSRCPSPFKEAPGQFTYSMIPQSYSMPDHPLNALQIAQPEDDVLFKPVVWAKQYSTPAPPSMPPVSPHTIAPSTYMPPLPAQPQPFFQYQQPQAFFDHAGVPFPNESAVYDLTSYEGFLGGMLPAPQDFDWNGQFSSTEYHS